MNGSTNLNEEQQEWYRRKFGVRYFAIPEQPLRPPRRVRRGRGDARDMQVLAIRQEQEKALRKALLTPEPSLRKALRKVKS